MNARTRKPRATTDDAQFHAARVLLEIARGTSADWDAWIRQLCRFEAEALCVERVSFWSVDDRLSMIRCDAGYVSSTRTFEHGAALFASELPDYFETIRDARILEIEDIYTDPRTRGLSEYAAARGISSMLDIPVWTEGRFSGVLCHEHVGPRRRWSHSEEELAIAASQVIASRLLARAHTAAEAAARRATFLDAATRSCLGSLDVVEVARSTVDFTVPRLADVALIWVSKYDGSLECAATKSADASKQRVLDRFAHATSVEVPAFAARVTRQKQSVLVPALSAASLAADVGPAQRAALEALGIRTGIGVPLIVDGRAIGAMTLFVAERRYGSDDQMLAEDLAVRVAAALEMARLYSMARQAIGARDDFLVLVAHELRTPLAALELMIDHKLRSAGEKQAGNDGATDEAIRRQARRLSRVVEDVLAASRIRAEGLALSRAPCDLACVVRECVADMSDRARRVGSPIALVMDAPIVSLFDASCLRRAVMALLDNAVKFGAGSPIDVSLRRRDDCAEIVVCDRGPGIDPQRFSSIFSPFERAVPKENFGGLGLGLYFAKAIVEAHGGTIAVHSRTGEQTNFTILLPLARP